MPGVRCRRVTRPIGTPCSSPPEHVTQLAPRHQVVRTPAGTAADAVPCVCVLAAGAGRTCNAGQRLLGVVCDGWKTHARRCCRHLRAGRDGGAALEHAHDGGARSHRRLRDGRHGHAPPARRPGQRARRGYIYICVYIYIYIYIYIANTCACTCALCCPQGMLSYFTHPCRLLPCQCTLHAPSLPPALPMHRKHKAKQHVSSAMCWSSAAAGENPEVAGRVPAKRLRLPCLLRR